MLKPSRVTIVAIFSVLVYSLVLNYDLPHFFYLLNILLLVWLLKALFIFSKVDESKISDRLGILLILSIILNQLVIVDLRLLVIFMVTISLLIIDIFTRINRLAKVKQYHLFIFSLLIISPIILLSLNSNNIEIYLFIVLLNLFYIAYLAKKYIKKQYHLIINKTPQMSKKTFLNQLEIARKVQKEFLPKKNSIQGAKIYSIYEPLWQIGGDFCNVINLRQKDLYSLIIGDVVGKGLAAALIMTDLVTTTQMVSYEKYDPSHVIKILNNRFCNNNYNNHSYFATACCMLFNMEKRVIEICNAGHEPPYIFRKKDNKVVKIDQNEVMLGVDCDKIDYERYSINFEDGDILALYTDGLLNVLDDDVENALHDCLNLKGEKIIECIKNKVEESNKTVIDDFLFLIIEFGGV
ncbi:MAG: PP2C family protein-serine/threonine phosphatase [Clostridia bacterium]